MRIEVIAGRCEGHAMCEATATDLFTLDDDGVVEVLVDTVPEDRVAAAEAAVRFCPVAALRAIP